MEIIGYIYTDFDTKFGAPRQSGIITSSYGRIVLEGEYSNPTAFRGLEDFSHIWVLWEFSEAKEKEWSPTVRPPMLGGNKRMGVFATRSPYRPNSIAISALKLERIEFCENCRTEIFVSGCDMMNNTPVIDIKPYLPYTDSIPDAKGGFTENIKDRSLDVCFSEKLVCKIPVEKRSTLTEVLESDPRPSYKGDEDKVYGFKFAGFEIKFKVVEKTLTVISVE